MADTPLHMSAQLHSTRPQIAILDFGSQYSHLIARRVRELNVFCELYSCLVKGEVLRKNNVIGIILSGGPNSVYEVSQSPPRAFPAASLSGFFRNLNPSFYGVPPTRVQEGAPHVDADVWAMISEQSLPVLGICYGMQEMAHVNGGRVAPGQKREYGKAMVTRAPVRLFLHCFTAFRPREGAPEALCRLKMGAEDEGQPRGGCGGPFLAGFHRSDSRSCGALVLANVQGNEEAAEVLFKGLPAEAQMWMSHGDKIHALPPGYVPPISTLVVLLLLRVLSPVCTSS